jgi:hypothetical protein
MIDIGILNLAKTAALEACMLGPADRSFSAQAFQQLFLQNATSLYKWASIDRFV